ncbi:nitroreductase family protein [Streptomyces sp. SAS_281]|uniref:Acg family FMN-binding oxidoreductase n=1 Tax=Streptomyces sp. SAS_281 TaxID=3412744 RepID=UPI00403C48DE
MRGPWRYGYPCSPPRTGRPRLRGRRTGQAVTANALTRTLVTSLVEDATRAPSMHNAQPWKFLHRSATDTVELYGDQAREMPHADPVRRALHLGCGAALFGLRVAAAHRGLRAEVTLLPASGDAWHLADVRLSRRESDDAADTEAATLHSALRERHTSRFPFTEERVPAEVMARLSTAAAREGCRLDVPGDWFADVLMELVRDSERLEAADPRMRAEVAAWTRTAAEWGGDAAAEGIPAYAFGPRQYDVTSPVRDFEPPHPGPSRTSARFEKRPQMALLGTSNDTPRDWLVAGQALHRVLLQATADGLSTSLMSQPLEWPELRALSRDPRSASGFVHMLLRLGYGPRGRATPRRPVSDVLVFV